MIDDTPNQPSATPKAEDQKPRVTIVANRQGITTNDNRPDGEWPLVDFPEGWTTTS